MQEINRIHSYDDFVKVLLAAGFSLGSGNDEGIYAILNWGWNEPPPYETPVQWYTGDPETDPCVWIDRILDERDDITYAKLLFKKSGFITREWAPFFLAARRGSVELSDAYEEGLISHSAKRIYDVVSAKEILPVEEIKRLGGFSREDKSKFDRALTELQMKLFISPCDRRYKVSQKGEEYGMPSTVFCTTRRFWGDDLFKEAAQISTDEAAEKIKTQVLRLSPAAEDAKIKRFIFG
ncbi:MAG: hypothetical protein FWE26_02610 [Coriobacteriia bacterium]|nr:hypothetical protein [Coriobacteriia bacterium]MCL2870508.1 hypothetical protein [Coriobacteriia bacterium]